MTCQWGQRCAVAVQALIPAAQIWSPLAPKRHLCQNAKLTDIKQDCLQTQRVTFPFTIYGRFHYLKLMACDVLMKVNVHFVLVLVDSRASRLKYKYKHGQYPYTAHISRTILKSCCFVTTVNKRGSTTFSNKLFLWLPKIRLYKLWLLFSPLAFMAAHVVPVRETKPEDTLWLKTFQKQFADHPNRIRSKLLVLSKCWPK